MFLAPSSVSSDPVSSNKVINEGNFHRKSQAGTGGRRQERTISSPAPSNVLIVLI